MELRTIEPKGRTKFEEAVSILPYAQVNLRMHRRRIAWGAITAVAAGVGWILARARATR